MFAVSPQSQGKGYGRALLNAFIEEAEPRRVNVALAGVDGELTLLGGCCFGSHILTPH